MCSNSQGGIVMKAFTTKSNHTGYCYTAAANTSAPILENLDTARVAVSILILDRKEF